MGALLQEAGAGASAGIRQLAATTESLVVPFGPDHFETQCGIKVRGTSIAEVYVPRAVAEVLGEERQFVRVSGLEQSATSCLIRFADGSGTVVPVVSDFIAALTWEDDELVDVAYEPSANSWRWDLYRQHSGELRTLRSVAAAASRSGRFRLEGDEAVGVAQNMQYAKGIDPTLAVYAAYAYFEQQDIERIRKMAEYMKNDIGTVFFDLALLGRMLVDKPVKPEDRIVPFVPLLSQGWALLKANRVRLHRTLDGIDETMRDSLWTLLDVTGAEMLEKALRTGDVR